ncbi:MAG TPA: GFA family protein [Rhodocyclaceae bacterium]|nr:GFA family protein [Rhodocyclaceae bacterium]
MKTYTGSCHCGAVRFEADVDLTQPTYRCNCSICVRNRFWPAIVKPENFRLLAGKDSLTQYLFNTRKNEHYFCKNCGVRSFGIGEMSPGQKIYGVNLGCLENAIPEELSAAPVVYCDGAHDNWQNAPAFTNYL